MLAFTFDPGAPGIHNGICPSSSPPTYFDSHAISNTIFQLGEFTQANSGGDISINPDLPTSAAAPGLGGFKLPRA